MGLTITPIETPITISGTSLTVESAYARIYMACNPDGVTMSIGYHIFANKQMYSENKPLATDIPNKSFNAVLDPLTQNQSITAALEFAKQGFEQLGYTATIDTE